MNRKYNPSKSSWVRGYSCIPLIVLAVLVPLCFYGCATKPKALLARAVPDVDRVLASLSHSGDDFKSFRGIGRFKTLRGTQRKIFRVVWIGSEPHDLRVETLGPWGQPILTFVMQGSTFLVHSRQDNQYFRGDATVDNLSRLTSIPVKGGDLFRLLSGRPPILPFHRAKIGVSSASGGWLLTLYTRWGRLVEKIWLKNDVQTVEKVELFDEWGDLLYRIAFSEFRQTESSRLPHNLGISDAEGPIWSLAVERFWTNVSIPDGAYVLDPSGGRIIDLDS